MTYAGDNELSEEIRQRVDETFRQSRGLAAEGKVQEATLGCEFVLRLDPLYEPARELLNRLQVGDLPSDASGEEPDDALPGSDEMPSFEIEQTSHPEPEFDLSSEIDDLLERRDFRTLLNLAEEHKAAVTSSPTLAEKVTLASQRLEAEPYLRTFIDSAEKAHRDGREEDARALIEKARALDPSHPALPPDHSRPEVNEGNDRIRELLEEGQRSLERGDYQGAIDSWSRIFLIDIDHTEANKRIEGARRLKAESERKTEEAFHEGVSQWELGATDKAREQFEKVLALSPNHPGAKEYLERLDARDVIGDAFDDPEPSGKEEIFTPPDSLTFARGRAPKQTVDDDLEVPSEVDLVFDDEEQPVEAPAPARTRTGMLANRRFLALAGGGVLLLLAAFAALYLKRDVFFPNSEEVQQVAQVDALARARKMHEAGQAKMAIAGLKRLTADHPQHAEAQALIAQWQAPAVVAEAPAGPSEQELAARDELVARAHGARESREYLRAASFYDGAAKIAPLDPQDQLLREEIRQRLAGLESQIQLYEQGDWEFVLPELWRLHRANPDDKDILRLMVDSYYNLGVRDLQRGDPPAAVEKLERAVELDGGDQGVLRLLRFSEVYGERPADLLYRIFVKYLPYR